MRSDRELSNIDHNDMTSEELAHVAAQEQADHAQYEANRAAEREAHRNR
jgi:hypothetical protein